MVSLTLADSPRSEGESSFSLEPAPATMKTSGREKRMYEPDFTSVVIEEVSLPFQEEKVLKLSYNDPMLKNYSILVIADTHHGAPTLTEHEGNFADSAFVRGGRRLTTFVARYPRYVHAEFLRHRVISRNAASSRARSVKATLRDVMETPVIPLFTVNQKGMGGKFADPETREALTKEWLLARDKDVTSVLSMLIHPRIREGKTDTEVAASYQELLDDYYANGYDSAGNPKEGYLSAHKQNFNRLIEAHTEFEEVITSSYWGNMLELRDAEEAQPEIKAIAVLIREGLKVSAPTDSWIHAPFVDRKTIPESHNFEDLRPILLQSSAEAAQVSYNDKSKSVRSTGTSELGERLLKLKHYSPFEHQAIASDVFYHDVAPTAEGIVTASDQLKSNFSEDWVQFRPMLAGVTK